MLNQNQEFLPSCVVSASFEEDQSIVIVKAATKDQCHITNQMKVGSYTVLVKDWKCRARLLYPNIVLHQGLIFSTSYFQEKYTKSGIDAEEDLQERQGSENWKVHVLRAGKRTGRTTFQFSRRCGSLEMGSCRKIWARLLRTFLQSELLKSFPVGGTWNL